MANQQLVDYIKGQIAAGVSRLDLEKAVTAAGWTAKDSADAFAVAEGRAPSAPVAPPAPAKPAAPVAPALPATPAAVRPVQQMQPAQPIQQSPMRPRRGGLWVFIIILVLLFAGAAAAYYYRTPIRDIINFYLNGAPPVVEPMPYIPPADIATTTASTTPVLPPATTTGSTTAH